MYSEPRLDTPPPASQFRRPWSPDPYDPLPQSSRANQQYERNEREYDAYDQYNYNHGYPQQPQQQRREPSDVSVEALDLADYAQTLRAHRPVDPNPSFYPQDLYPPSLHPPSLYRGETLSSNSHTSASHASRRHFSLPPARNSSSTASPLNRAHDSPYLTDSPPFATQSIYGQSEIDIAQFPAWSRSWYNNKPHHATSPDIYTTLPKSHFPKVKRSPFDPGTNSHSYPGSDLHQEPYTSSYGHDSARNILPWSSDPPEYGPGIDPGLKEERLRMLEREFGPNSRSKMKGRDDGNDFVDEDGKPLVGTVDQQGNLVTEGPKKRAATRAAQILLALTAGIPSIYAALVLKPIPPPPPQNKPAAFILYVLSIITLLALLYFFVFRACCGSRKRRGNGPTGGMGMAGLGGMMVLPVHGGNKSGKKPGGKKGNKGQGGAGDVQVNLIVDPEMFGGSRQEEEDEEQDWEDDGSMPGGYDSQRRSGRGKRPKKRRSVFAGLAMEEEWKRARKWAKRVCAVDVLGLALWGAEFVYILIGNRCPSGAFDGWCNAYNVSSAAACLLGVAFGLSVFFDVKDLHASRTSPRTRS